MHIQFSCISENVKIIDLSDFSIHGSFICRHNSSFTKPGYNFLRDKIIHKLYKSSAKYEKIEDNS